MASLLSLTVPDLRYCQLLYEGSCDSDAVTQWIGSSEWIRSQYKLYLLSLLSSSIAGDSRAHDDFNPQFMKQFASSTVFRSWLETPHQGILATPPKHICEGDMSLSDIKRQLLARVSDYGVVSKNDQVSKVAHDTGRTWCQ